MKSKTAKVFMALILCPLVMLGLSFVLPKRYTATMSLMLDPSIAQSNPDNPDAPIVSALNITRGHSIETEIDKLTGTEVLLDAINLTSQQHPKVFLDPDQAAANYADLVNRIRIDNNRNSDIVDVRVTMDDPAVAADTANNIGKAYMNFNDKISAAAGNGALIHINKDLSDKQQDLDEIDAKIAAMKEKYHITDPDATGQMYDKQVKDMQFQIAQVTAQLQGAQGSLSSTQAALQSTPKYLKTESGEQINPVATDLDQRISQTESDLGAARAKYTDDYPQVKQYQEALNTLKLQRAHTPSTILAVVNTSLNPNYTAAQDAFNQAQANVQSYGGNLSALQGKYDELLKEGNTYPEAEKDLAALTMEKTATESQYQLLIQQRQGIDVNGGLGHEALAQIVSIAMPSSVPSFPNPKVFVLMGLAVGIIISALIVMPKAPEVVYAPTVGDALALDATSIRASANMLPPTAPEPEPARPAIGQGKAE